MDNRILTIQEIQMKWVGIRNHAYRLQARGCWHFWFAWYPVVVHKYPDGAKKKVWWEKVLRKGEYVHLGLCEADWIYEYKEIDE